MANFGGLITVQVFYQGSFSPNPLRYNEGLMITLTTVDFSIMDFDECHRFLKDLVPCGNVYYQVPKKILDKGLRVLSCQENYARFLDHAYRYGKINLYIDHMCDDLTQYVGEDGLNDSEDEDSVFSDNISLDHVPDDDDDEVVSFNKTKRDPFLSKLCIDEINNEEDEVFPTHNDSVDWKDMVPVLGMKFEDCKQLKELLTNYAVANGYGLRYEKNDSTRLLVRCGQGRCPFRLWATWMSKEQSFQIKSLNDNHNCCRNFNLGSLVSYAWIAKRYAKEILEKPHMSYRDMQHDVKEKFNLKVSISMCRRAKAAALEELEGTLQEHYAKLWSYAEEIRRSNPGSTVTLDVITMPDGTNYFSRFYVCFKGLKDGWLEGCRRVISIDGCFLKGVCKGELLAAIGRDANNQMFPLAWAVVSIENKDTWKWFLELLAEDIGMQSGQGLTLLSDQHKGLIAAVHDVLPNAEHRQCARHVFANFKKRFSGAKFLNKFWAAANASTENEFKAKMEEIKGMSVQAFTYLMERNPKSWSRAYFEVDRCCGAIENGICESFNSTIVKARRKPIITMLEEIRLYAMDRVYRRRLEAQRWDVQICPAIRDEIDELKKEQRFWDIRPSGFHEFEAIYGTNAYVVNIDTRTCTCRVWQLTGIPCEHGIGALSFLNHDVNKYVSVVFTPDMYLNAYRYGLKPMNGSSMWPTTSYTPALPPKNRRMPGRPAVKRKRHPSEGTSNTKKKKISKKGVIITCSICKARGHNKSRCPRKEQAGTSNVNTSKKLKPRKKRNVDDTRDEEPPILEDSDLMFDVDDLLDEEALVVEDMDEEPAILD